MTRNLAALTALIALSGCDLLFPEDPRIGSEISNDCATRVAALLGPTSSYRKYEEEMGVPTFTFDITKMSLDDMQMLSVEGSDETAGRRAMETTNETSTAVANFMAMEVDEKGAFFMGRDPALYRVRGGLQPKENMIATGCARQQEGMRLIMIDVGPVPSEPEPETDEADSENNNDNETDS